MRIPAILVFLCTSISLIGCSSMRGNVVPQTGPSMEQVYDRMGIHSSGTSPSKIADSPQASGDDYSSQGGEADIATIRQTVNTVNNSGVRRANAAVETNTFRKLPNPELALFVYPHLAGNAEVPIPGYSTVFNAYDRDHYALPQETARDMRDK